MLDQDKLTKIVPSNVPGLNESMQWILCGWIDALVDDSEFYEILERIRAVDREAAGRLEEAFTAHANEVADTAFALGWQLRADPSRLVLAEPK